MLFHSIWVLLSYGLNHYHIVDLRNKSMSQTNMTLHNITGYIKLVTNVVYIVVSKVKIEVTVNFITVCVDIDSY